MTAIELRHIDLNLGKNTVLKKDQPACTYGRGWSSSDQAVLEKAHCFGL